MLKPLLVERFLDYCDLQVFFTYWLPLTVPLSQTQTSSDPRLLLPALGAIWRNSCNGVMVDVGAHFGDFSKAMLNFFGSHSQCGKPPLLGIEPAPWAARHLAWRAKHYGWSRGRHGVRSGFGCGINRARGVRGKFGRTCFSLERVGVTDRRGAAAKTATFYAYTGAESEQSSLEHDITQFDWDVHLIGPPRPARTGEGAFQVPVATLDDVLLNHTWIATEYSERSMSGIDLNVTAAPQVFLLKIDAEGHDDRVIRGAENLLKHRRIRFLLFEHGRRPGMAVQHGEQRTLKSSIQYLRRWGYACFLILDDSNGGILLSPISRPQWRFIFIGKKLNMQ